MKQKERINVLYIITKLELGGAQKVCLALEDGLKKLDNNPILISSNEGYFVEKIKNKDNFILLSGLKREISFKYIFQEISNFLELIKKIKEIKKYNKKLIVHTHSTKAGIIGRWAAFFAGVKTRIHTIHGYGFNKHQNWSRWSLIYSLELITSFITTHYVCVSSEDVKIGIKLFPRFSKKHSIIRAAVNFENFFVPAKKASDTKEEFFTFGTIACFKPQKNIFDLLKAFKEVHEKNNLTRLEIIGDGILRKDIENFIAENHLTSCISLHGWKDDVSSIMKNWNAFVLSSLWEGLPCSVVEARLMKLPVLSYNTGGIHDVIIQGENGFLYKQKDYLQLAEGMLELSKNRELYLKLSLYNDNLSDFQEEKMIKEHIKLYRKNCSNIDFYL